MKQINIAIIGLDSPHTIEFSRRMQAPHCPSLQLVDGMCVTSVFRSASLFATEKVQDERQSELEAFGISVTTNFLTAVEECDAIMILLNDPATHFTYFEKCVTLGKPIFVDKPLADTLAHGQEMVVSAMEHNIPLFSSSSLRFSPALKSARAIVKKPRLCSVYGALGTPPSGSGIVWYGVHVFEMLQWIMGSGAERVFMRYDPLGALITVDYDNRRRGIIELTRGVWSYGGILRDNWKAAPFFVDGSVLYYNQLFEIKKFFMGGIPPISVFDTLEVLALIDAAEQSAKTGKSVTINHVDRKGLQSKTI